MSNGSPEDVLHSSAQDKRQAFISPLLSIAILVVLYFWLGDKPWKALQTPQAASESRPYYPRAAEQGPDYSGNADERPISREEMREIRSQLEQILADETRRTDETRQAIDAAASREALQNAETVAVGALAKKCKESLSKMKALTVQWESDYAPLLTNDRGRRLASNEKTLQTYLLATTGEFPDVGDSIDWLAEYKEVVDPLQDAKAQGIEDYSTSPEDRTFFESLLARIKEANQRLEQRRRTMEVILATTSGFDPGPLTLTQSIEKIEKEKTSTFVEKLEQVYKQKLQETIDEQAEFVLKAKKERIVAESQLKAQQERMAAHAANRQTESLSKDEAIAQKEAREKQLEKEFVFEKSEINRLLGAFLGKGSQQPLPDYSLEKPYWYVANNVAGPISLGRLASLGALDQTEAGYELLYHIGGSANNNRPRTGFPTYTTKGVVNPTIMAKVKRASELLNKYGELLRKKRLIAP